VDAMRFGGCTAFNRYGPGLCYAASWIGAEAMGTPGILFGRPFRADLLEPNPGPKAFGPGLLCYATSRHSPFRPFAHSPTRSRREGSNMAGSAATFLHEPLFAKTG